MRRTYLYSMLASAFLSSSFIFAGAKLVFINQHDDPVKVRLRGWQRMEGWSYEQEKPRFVNPDFSVDWAPALKSEITQNILDVYDINDKLIDTIGLSKKTKKELELEEKYLKDKEEATKKALEEEQKEAMKKGVCVPGDYTRIITFEERDLYQDEIRKGGTSVSSVFKIGKDLFEKTRENALDVFHGAFGPVRKELRTKKGTAVYDIIHRNPYMKKQAQMRMGGSVSAIGEQKAFNARQKKVKEAQAKLLGHTFKADEKPLVVAFVASGGGQRARLCTIGSSIAAQDTGLLDCATYFSTLSGSTWFLAPWLYMGISLKDMKKRAIEDAMRQLGPKEIKKDVVDIVNSLGVKFAFGQSINVIDLYGALLGAYYLYGYGDGNSPQRTYLSDITSKIETGNHVIPVFTAVTAEVGIEQEWCFFTPWEFGSRWFGTKGAYVPVWAFGRKFENGKTKNWGSAKSPLYAPRSTLPFLMAIWGSAIAGSAEQAYDQVISGMTSGPLKAVLRYAMTQTDFKETRLFWAEVFNPMYKIPEFKSRGKYLGLADAGVKMGCPIFDTYRRPKDKKIKDGSAPDVIIVFEASQTVAAKELELQVKYANRHNLPFPKINYDEIGKDIISIFTKNPDPKKYADHEIPTVIYMPRITSKKVINDIIKKTKNDPALAYLGKLGKRLRKFDVQQCMGASCSTFNFKHVGKMGGLLTSEQLVNMTDFNLRVSIEKIKKVMKKRLELNRIRDGIK